MTDYSWERFPASTIDALFQAVEIDDVVDPEVSLPDPIRPGGSDQEMRRCFALCLQFWEDGVRRDELLRLTGLLLRDGDLSAANRLRYKHIRARYKHLRFALALYSVRHKPPLLFAATVALMGHLQDAFRNGHSAAVTRHARALRLLLAWPLWAWTRRALLRCRLDSAEGFAAYGRAQMRRLEEMTEQPFLTGPQFHAVRKIVSRQVSFCDTRRSLAPNDHDYRMSRFLSAINGLMGSRHDEMVEQALSGARPYRAPMALDADIKDRLIRLIAAHPYS